MSNESNNDRRDKLAVALDVDDLVVALRMARDVKPWFGVAKVGLELFAAAGPDVVGLLSEAGFKGFLDLKVHDIPTTGNKAARVIGSFRASHPPLHAPGRAGVPPAGGPGLHARAHAPALPPATPPPG